MPRKKKQHTLVQMAAIKAAKEAEIKVQEGRVPIVLSADALIALLWDKFQRHIRGDPLALLDAASDCLLVLAKGMQEPIHHPSVQVFEAPDLEPIDETEEQGEEILCPKCGNEHAQCTKLRFADVPICDSCIAVFEEEAGGNQEQAIANYEAWAKDVAAG